MTGLKKQTRMESVLKIDLNQKLQVVGWEADWGPRRGRRKQDPEGTDPRAQCLSPASSPQRLLKRLPGAPQDNPSRIHQTAETPG